MLNLFRSQTFQISIQKPDATRAFVFDVEAGITKPAPQVDPPSGMLLNIVDFDAVMVELHNLWHLQTWSSLQTLLEKSREFLAGRFAKHGCALTELTLREKRGFWLKWYGQGLLMGHEEIQEVAGNLYRLSSEEAFVESQVETQKRVVIGAEFFQDVFKSNPHLQSLFVENFGNSEKWSYRRA